MKPALEKFLIIGATLAAISLFIFGSMWPSIKEKKQNMDDWFNKTNVPEAYLTPSETTFGLAYLEYADEWEVGLLHITKVG